MNGGKSDASTSTDDAKDRPLCLYYFTHPFGVLSPEPPSVSAALPPGSVARAFLDMQPLPLPSFYWPPAPAPASPRSTSPSPGVAYELGDARVHPHPVSVLNVAQTRRPAPPLSSPLSCTLSTPLSCSLSSPVSCSLPCPLWLEARVGAGFPRRAPYSRILPPLLLPSPRHLTDYSSDDIWPRKCLSSKFSLPPIEMPPPALAGETSTPESWRREELRCVESVSVSVNVSGKEGKCRRKLGVSKASRRGLGRGRGRGRDVRRMVTCLMRRAITGRRWLQASSPSPALQRALCAIRDAWPEPPSRTQRCCVSSPMYYARDSALERENTIEGDSERKSGWSAMPGGALLAERALRADASPGLLRRRYSVPETIMRKYRLAQQVSDSEETGTFGTGCSGACPSPPRSAGDSPRHLRRDRELMRKSALLRRMWARPLPALRPAPAPPPPACRCELGGSRDQLLSLSPPPRRALSPSPPSTCAETAYALSERSASAELSPLRAPTPPLDRSYDSSDTFSNSMSTAKETPGSSQLARAASESSGEGPPAGRGSVTLPCRAGEDRNGNALTSERLVCDDEQGAAPYEVLEIIVSESASSSPPRPAPPPLPADRNVNIDEYVSRVLVESLNSLTDRLEGMNAAVPAARKLSVVEKEIKVRLQNAAVNTIVHLSPTSNHQIIFGNEELYERRAPPFRALSPPEPRDECNNPRARSPRHNNNASRSASPTPTPTPRTDAFDTIIQHDSVNRAVLHQIQKLFRGEFLHEDSESGLREQISNVDVFLSGAGADTISVSTHGADAGTDSSPGSGPGSGPGPELGVGAGSCYRELARAALVPRRSALPHSASMEVNTSEEEEEERDPLGSDAASLVDSLDDPASPRAPSRRCAPRPTFHQLPERGPPPRPHPHPGEAFFVRIRDDATPEGARVSEYMPERIRQKLVRRHRRRELRAECARRGKVRRLREELQAARVPAAPAPAPAPVAGSHGNLDRRNGRRDPESCRDRERTRGGVQEARRRRPDGDERNRSRRSEKHQVCGKLVARPAPATAERPPHRIYQKSEIREGDKCIEILEILEYSRSSADSSPPDESGARLPPRRSRIPVPVPGPGSGPGPEPPRHMRLTGGDAPLARLLLRAFTPAPHPAPHPAPAPPPPEPRARANSLRFKRVFDMIPEERPSLGVDSSADAEEAENARWASAPASPPAPAPRPPAESPRRGATRSAGAGTSPPDEARRVRNQTTMTSPSSKSAATSPWHPSPPAPASPPPPPPRPPPPREGSKEGCDSERGERRSGRTQYDGERRGARGGGAGGAGSAESSGESGGSLLCSLAPRWLSARRRRRARRSPPRSPSPSPSPPPSPQGAGGWSVTVAGSCRAALPADVEMRLRFPRPNPARSPSPSHHARRHSRASTNQECRCAACRPPRPALPAARPDRLALAMKKEAQECSILARKSMRMSSASAQLPGLPETPRAARCNLTHSVKMRRACSLRCWLPEPLPPPPLRPHARAPDPGNDLSPDDPHAYIRANNGLSVLGCAIIPELKPRVPTMSERDLTRIYTPRHYLRS